MITCNVLNQLWNETRKVKLKNWYIYNQVYRWEWVSFRDFRASQSKLFLYTFFHNQFFLLTYYYGIFLFACGTTLTIYKFFFIIYLSGQGIFNWPNSALQFFLNNTFISVFLFFTFPRFVAQELRDITFNKNTKTFETLRSKIEFDTQDSPLYVSFLLISFIIISCSELWINIRDFLWQILKHKSKFIELFFNSFPLTIHSSE